MTVVGVDIILFFFYPHADSDKLGYSPGLTYLFDYYTTTMTDLMGNRGGGGGFSLYGNAELQVLDKCHLALQLHNNTLLAVTSLGAEKRNSENFSDALERFPLHFSFQDGVVSYLCPLMDEPFWVLNVKRGLLSALQNSLPVTGQEKLEEVDISGVCPTVYQKKGDSLLKMKDLENCSSRAFPNTFLQMTSLQDAKSTQLLQGWLECTQNYHEGVLNNVNCSETLSFRPFSEDGQGVQSKVELALKLQGSRRLITIKPEHRSLRVTNLLYERESGLKRERRELHAKDVLETVRQLCGRYHLPLEVADLFPLLVFQISELPSSELKMLWDSSLQMCLRNPLLDALPMCRTSVCVSFMFDQLSQVNQLAREAWIYSLAFIPEPTQDMLNRAVNLLESSLVNQATLLSVSTMLNQFCVRHSACANMTPVQNAARIFGKTLQEGCQPYNEKQRMKLVLVLKAIGNGGQAMSSLASLLAKCVAKTSTPTSLRLIGLEAFRRIPCETDRSMLMELYKDVQENPEIRISSYFQAMKCPTSALLQTVKAILRVEPSLQVGSFVWSHLTQVMETNDSLKTGIKKMLTPDLLSKDFKLEPWRYSWYYDATVHSGKHNT
uniref:Vitellogenin domain-containing protein n=1 Tax=Eptatretus burgeri TaxID=7764 RepID=A0A8C4QK32_EPTBU